MIIGIQLTILKGFFQSNIFRIRLIVIIVLNHHIYRYDIILSDVIYNMIVK